MAISKVVTFTDKKWGSATDPYTGSIDCTGCDALYVMVQTNQSQNVSGMTYNGVSMTQVSAITSATNKSWVYRLANPTTGTNTLSVDFDASCSYFHVTAIGLSGTNTASLEGATPVTYYSNSSVSNFNGSITTQYDNSWVLDFLAIGGDAGSLAGNNSQTLQANYADGFRSVVGSLAVASAGATTTNYTLSGANYIYSRTVIELRQSAASTSIKTVNGIAKASVKAIGGVSMASIKSINGLN